MVAGWSPSKPADWPARPMVLLPFQGNCMMLATVVANKEPKEGQSFFPLSVDYQEKFASAGRIPGSFFKREARLNDYEILTSRLIDRALRPLFPEDYFCEVQVLIITDLQ